MRGVALTPVEEMQLGDRLLAEARGLPGVENATPTISVPFWSSEGRALFVPGVDSVRKLGRIALLVGRPIGALLFHVSSHDPLVFGLVAAMLVVVGILASTIPAARATRVDPNVALRSE